MQGSSEIGLKPCKMKGKTDKSPQLHMYQVPLIQFINKEHELYQLADRINWDEIEQDLTEYYCVDNGRPSIHQKLLPDQEPVVAFSQFLVSEDIPLPILYVRH